jgi:hypothetical protein
MFSATDHVFIRTTSLHIKSDPMEMDLLDLAESFCQPIVDDEALRCPLLDLQRFKDLIIDRNSLHFCAWVKCANRLRSHEDDDGPIFCSKDCQFLSQQFSASLIRDNPHSAVGRVVERFPDQQPPKPLKSFVPDGIEGFRVRVGPQRHILDAIEEWFGGFRVTSFSGMSPVQTKIFDFVNECLRAIDAQLKKVEPVVAFFTNINAKDPNVLLTAPKPVQMAFALAVFEYLTEAEVLPALPTFDIAPALYEDVSGIVAQADAEDEWMG